jgi:hypothetical protein
MRINGEWLQCDDGDIRPVIRGEILGQDGQWRELEFLVDTGADRSLISATVLEDSQLPHLPQDVPVGGLGGMADTVIVQTQMRLTRDDGKTFVVRGKFAACTQVEALELSVLGRDVLDHFTLIVDRAEELVVMLAGHHSYSIQGPS